MSRVDRKKPSEDPCGGVSEIIGAILMISLVVMAVALVAMMLNSQTTPQELPNVNFMTGTNADGTELYLYHNGGDMLRRGEFAVVTDVDPSPRTDYIISDGSDEWSLGKNLILTEATPPTSVALIYTAGSEQGGVVLKSGASNVAVLKETIRPDATPVPVGGTTGGSGGLDTSNPQNVVNYILQNTSLIADALNQSPSTVGPVVANVIVANSTVLFKNSKIDIDRDGADTYFFRFKVTKPGSSISVSGFSPNPKPLDVGDIVTIYMRSSPGGYKVFGMGDQLWEIHASGVNVNITKGSVIDYQSNEVISHAWITGYEDLSSTMSITTTGSNEAGTVFIQYGKTWIDSPDNDDNIIVSNIRPVGLGLYLLEYDSSAHLVYFVGNAETTTVNGLPCSATACACTEPGCVYP